MNLLRNLVSPFFVIMLSASMNAQPCIPNGIAVVEACEWNNTESIWESAVDISVSINQSCALTEVCYSRAGDGAFDCINVSGLNLLDGSTYHLELPGAGIYQIWTATPAGTSTIEEININCYDETMDCNNPYAINYISNGSNPGEEACIYDTYICDCSGTSHSMGVLTYLGDGELESLTNGKTWNGNNVHFGCNVWGFDCGDSGINFDPYGVCSGNIPPNNGCSSPGCAPLTLGIQAAPCSVGPYGYESVISFNFGVSDGCTVSELHYQVNSGAWNMIDFLPEGGYFNGDEFLLLDAVPNASYQCYFRTSSGAVSPFFNFQNGALCSDPSDVCDCDGNKWPEAFTSYIGNGINNDGFTNQDGHFVNFDCAAWSYDCGDGSGTADPFNVCSGSIPPSRGCQTYNFGCTDDTACNFNPAAIADDGSCDYSCQGCTDPTACNFDGAATLDNGTCNYDCQGCTDPFACNFDSNASQDDGSCFYDCLGCTDESACNFDPSATIIDGSCDYSCLGCTDNSACNFNVSATTDDGSCDYSCFGCTDNSACNFDLVATLDDGSCNFDCFGCTDVTACNYSPFATEDNGTCDYTCFGCIDDAACNYDVFATEDDGSCDYSCLGCVESSACNYNPQATIDDGSCTFMCYGCIDNTACNYSPVAYIDDGSCSFDCNGCTDPLACNYSASAINEDGSCLFDCFGCTNPFACNYDESALVDDESCTFPTQFLDCNGECFNDADNDGVCDEQEIHGCTYILACNFNPNASEDDGFCDFDSCAGCTYLMAVNYNPDATIDDGSCIYSETQTCVGDLNNDSAINVTDLILLLQLYGETCE